MGHILFNIFVLDVRQGLPEMVNHKFYADDLKLIEPVCSTGRARLQEAIDAVVSWCLKNDMISAAKCAVLSSFGLDPPFNLAGVPLPSLPHYRDLGVLVDPELLFSAHLASILRSTAMVSNMIFRCFVGKDPEFYLRLYTSLLIPRLTYCSEVWRPFRISDLVSLERVQRRRFLRRVAARCSVPLESLPPLPPVSELFDRADKKLFERLTQLESFNSILTVQVNDRRRGSIISTKSRARTDIVNNSYAWRFACSSRRG